MTAMSAYHQQSTNVLNDASAQYSIENILTEPRPYFSTCAPLQLLRSHTCSMPYARMTGMLARRLQGKRLQPLLNCYHTAVLSFGEGSQVQSLLSLQ